ncbi:hypothetical protein DM860_014748 [Cuscuta australis]|uniref:Uncharacterized protein n=1 Tax=Cuscuta australis TaxID=267555 RepID=A0A328DL24_9ASTE|nr:hypothetical protein DM860_014748 [Cuscuta australis]
MRVSFQSYFHWSGLPFPRAEAEHMTCLRKSPGGRPARGGPRMTDPAGAERVPLSGWSSMILCSFLLWSRQVGLSEVGLGRLSIGLDTPIPGYPS